MVELLSESRTMVAGFDTNGRLIESNPAFKRRFGGEIDTLFALFASEEKNAVQLELLQRGRFKGYAKIATREGESGSHVVIETIHDRQGNVQSYLLSVEPIQNAKAEEDANLYYSATHDGLTRLPNRFFFTQKLEESLHRVRRNHTEGALFFIDLDHFKEINDTHGHLVGDKVIEIIGKRLATSI